MQLFRTLATFRLIQPIVRAVLHIFSSTGIATEPQSLMHNLIHSGTNLEYTKTHNRQVVLQAIRQNPKISRPELCAMTGLTAQTLSKISQDLMDDGLIEIVGRRSEGRGHPASQFRVSPNGGFAIGVNADQDHVTIVLVDLSGKMRGRVRHNVRFPTLDDAVPLVTAAISKLFEEVPGSKARTYGMGLAVPGRITHEGELTYPPRNMGSWTDQSLSELFSSQTGIPVWVENNANSAAVGESFYGVGAKHRNFFHVFLGTGVGCGIILDGLLYRGATGIAGEFGLFPKSEIGPGGGDGSFQNLSNQISFYDVFERLENQDAIGSEIRTVEDLTLSGHPAIEEWLDGATKALLGPISSVQSLLDPEVFVFGGGVPTEVMQRLVSRLEAAVSGWHGGRLVVPKFLTATTGRDGAALGAATLPFYHTLSVRPHGLLKKAGRPKQLLRVNA